MSVPTRTLLALATAASLLASPPPARADGSFHARLAVANQRVARTPNDPGALLARAELYRRHGDSAFALADLEHAARLDPALSGVNHIRGLVFLDAGESARAEGALRTFLRTNPESPAARVALARALLRLQRPLEAAGEYERVLKFRTVPIPEYYFERARALAAAGDEHLPEALAALDQGLSKLGPVPTLQNYAVELELRRRDFDAALARLDLVAPTGGRQESWLARRGSVLELAGRPQQAQTAYAQAISALEKLPENRRQTPAMRRLEAKLRASVDQLSR